MDRVGSSAKQIGATRQVDLPIVDNLVDDLLCRTHGFCPRLLIIHNGEVRRTEFQRGHGHEREQHQHHQADDEHYPALLVH